MDAPSPRRSIGARGAILAVVVAAMLFSSVYPLGRMVSLKREIAALEAQDQALDEQLADLQQERARLLTDAEVEQLARERLGFVRPGEVPFVVVAPRGDQDEPEPILPLEEPSPTSEGLFERWWNALRHAARAM